MNRISTLSINTEDEFFKLLSNNRAVLFYFSTMSCAVGVSLEPKVKNLLSSKYQKIIFCSIDMNASPELCASHQVFVEPSILLFVGGKEFIRVSRNIGLLPLEKSISRIYQLAFE
jgi:thioredoxin 1